MNGQGNGGAARRIRPRSLGDQFQGYDSDSPVTGFGLFRFGASNVGRRERDPTNPCVDCSLRCPGKDWCKFWLNWGGR